MHLNCILSICLSLCITLCTSTTTFAQLSRETAEPKLSYPNSTLYIGFVLSNMDDLLEMDKGSARGFQLGYEYSIGKQYRFSSGLYFQQIAGTFKKIPEYSAAGIMGEGEAFSIYGFKVPLMAGYRTASLSKIAVQVDGGLQWHTGFIASHTAVDAQGWMPERHALALAVRAGISWHQFLLSIQWEKGVTPVFQAMKGYQLDILACSAGFSF